MCLSSWNGVFHSQTLFRILEAGGSIYEDCSFSLRHDIERTESVRPPSWPKLVPAPTKAISINTNQRKRLSKRELNISNQYNRSRVGVGDKLK
jgi:hypothetical protein